MSATNTFEIVSSDNLPFWISNIPDIQVRKQYITPVSDTNDFKIVPKQSIVKKI